MVIFLHPLQDLLRSIYSSVQKWIKTRLFSSPINILITILLVWFFVITIPMILEWLFFKANFSAISSKECRNSKGACWAFIINKYRLIFFGIYPYNEQWRPFLVILILISMLVISGVQKFWNYFLPIFWIFGLCTVALLMQGGIFGLIYIDSSSWGGLPLTLILSTFGIIISLPIGVLLALGRNSNMLIIEFFCMGYIELLRGVPLISLLFISSVIVPIVFPESYISGKLLRAQVAIILFASAYVAETIRGGLQAISIGQYEGSNSLGLNYWQQMHKVILPQALRIVISPLIGIFISIFKDTSLVVTIGILDLTLTSKAALSDVAWHGVGIETYVFISFIYFIFCYLISKYSEYFLEKRFNNIYLH